MSIWKAKAFIRNLVLAVAVVVLVLGSSVVTALEDGTGSKGLFAASGVRGSIDRTGEPTIIHTRYVKPNLELLLGENGTPRDLAAESTLTLNLFDDVVLVAVLDQVEPNYGGGFTWVGQVQDEPLSLVTLVVNDGVMAGTVSLPDGSFEISYAGNGVHAVHEIDQSAFPPEAGPIPVDVPEGEAVEAVPAAVADDGSVIDVMVVYTPSARGAVGGTTAMVNLINLAVAETNQSYNYSGVSQRLNLVHTAEVSYVETDFYAALYDVTDPNDGKMDNVHTLRDTYFADEVVLIINDTEFCGLAWLMQTVSTAFEEHAFAVVHWGCATGYYSFGHELGHNMGAQHDHYAVTKYGQAAGAYWYSYGYVDTTRRWRTVMAYNTECEDQVPSFYCTRIPFWSNPSVSYGGYPTGTSSADNQLNLDNTAWTVANFRPSPPNAPTGLVATTVSPSRIDLSWTDTSDDETGFRIERKIGSGLWSTLATVGANTTSYPNTGLVPETTYSYRVYAYNARGDSDPSNTASDTTPPSAPTGLVATTVAPLRIALWWNDTSSAETGFRIERKIGDGSWSTLVTLGAGTTSYPDTDVDPETTYSYRVFAYNAHGDSNPSNIASDTTPPSAPTGLVATAMLPSRIDLSWTDTSSAETGFRIEHMPAGGSWSPLATVGANTTSYPHTGLTPETTHSYRVFAYNAHGDSGPSNTLMATTPPIIIGPLAYDGPIIDDDDVGGTSGDGNGYVNCGETVGLTVMLTNEGNTAVEGINSELSFVGGTGVDDVSWTGNTMSTYPNIAGGASAGNTLAFEFSVEPLAEHGHWIDFELAITASNWSGAPVEFSLPILCHATADFWFYLPLIGR